MRDYAIRRIFLMIPVIFGVLLITFTLSHVIGDPVAAYVTERTTEEHIQMIITKHHLDEPLHIQFFYYLSDLLHGDWGYSQTGHQPVIQCIADFFPATLELSLVAIVLSLAMGIPLGIISAVKKDKPVDHVSRIYSLSGISMPIFWFALMMQYVFFFWFKTHGLPYLPSGFRAHWLTEIEHPLTRITGLYILDSLLTLNWPMLVDSIAHIIMPAFCLAYLQMALITRMMRSSMLEVMRQDYIILARSKGLSERVVIYKHALKNALIPTVTVTGLAFGALLAGAVLTETIFSWPGIGRWATSAILTTDFGGIMGFVLVVAFVYVLVNLLVDLLYGVLDPRIRYG